MSTESASGYSRKNPFPATLTVNRKLTAEGSNKDTRHFEISLAGSGLDYEVGDSLGVFPSNDPALVDKLLQTLGFSGDEIVPNADKVSVPLRDALSTSYIITSPDKKLLGAIAEKDSSATFLTDLLDPAFKTNLDEYLWGRDVLDPLLEFTAAKFTPEEFVANLRKLQPRLYSIASSRKVVGENVHLTIAVVRYESFNRPRAGVASSYLAERVGDGKIPVFYHTAKHFRVPENPDTAMIMVGPGTGIAPFRAMLQEPADDLGMTISPGHDQRSPAEVVAGLDVRASREERINQGDAPDPLNRHTRSIRPPNPLLPRAASPDPGSHCTCKASGAPGWHGHACVAMDRRGMAVRLLRITQSRKRGHAA